MEKSHFHKILFPNIKVFASIFADKLQMWLTSNDLLTKLHAWIVLGDEAPSLSIDKKHFLELLSAEDLTYRFYLWEENVNLLKTGYLAPTDLMDKKNYFIELAKNMNKIHE